MSNNGVKATTVLGSFRKSKQEKDNSSLFADEEYIVDKSQQPGWLTRQLLKQSGGFASKYYKADEARASSMLAVPKFASVSLATYAFMKVGSPLFNPRHFEGLPKIYDIEPSLLAKTIAAGGIWFVISTFDTAVLKNMRTTQAARRAIEEGHIKPNKDAQLNLSGAFLRYGISVASVGITLPILMMSVSEDTIDRYLQETYYDVPNAELVAEFREFQETQQSQLLSLEETRIELRNRLAELQTQETVATETQVTQLSSLAAEISRLLGVRAAAEQELIQEERNRDEAIERIRIEREGLGDVIPGCRPEVPNAPDCDIAMADRDAALQRISSIERNIELYNSQIASAEREIQRIEGEIRTATQNFNQGIQTERTSVQSQITDLNAQITALASVLNEADTPEQRAANDDRYRDFDPTFTERMKGFLEYLHVLDPPEEVAGLSDRGTPYDLSLYALIGLALISFELGVFAAASGNRANSGEVRAYLADIVNSGRAGEIFKNIKERLEILDELDDAQYGQARRDIAAERLKAELFEEAMEEARNDPDLRKRILDKLMKDLDPNAEPKENPSKKTGHEPS